MEKNQIVDSKLKAKPKSYQPIYLQKNNNTSYVFLIKSPWTLYA